MTGEGPAPGDLLLTIREAAAAIGANRTTVGNWVSRGLVGGQKDAQGRVLVSVARCRELAATSRERRATGYERRTPRGDPPPGAPEGSQRLCDMVLSLGITRVAIVARGRTLGIEPMRWRTQYWYTPEDADRIASRPACTGGRPVSIPREEGETEEAYHARLAEVRRERRRESATRSREAKRAAAAPPSVTVPQIVKPAPTVSRFWMRERDRREAAEAREALEAAEAELAPPVALSARAAREEAAQREAALALEEADRARAREERERAQERQREREAQRLRAREAAREARALHDGRVVASQRAMHAAIEAGRRAGVPFLLLCRAQEGDPPGYPSQWRAGSLALLRSGEEGWSGHSRWRRTGLGRWESTPYQSPIDVRSGMPLAEEQVSMPPRGEG